MKFAPHIKTTLLLLGCIPFFSLCNNGPRILPLPEYMVVSQPDSSEVLLRDFVHTQTLTALFYVDGDCSACLLELNRWKRFFAEHSLLSPLLVVKTQHPLIIPIFLEINGLSFPTLYDYDLTIWIQNCLGAETTLIVLNRDAEVLYTGKSERGASFSRFYKKMKTQSIDN